MDRCLCYVCNAEVRDGTFPAVLVCPESSQPIIPLNYLLTRWNWCFWSADWIIRNVGHSYSPWLVSLICPIWSPCFNNLLSCTTYSCWTIIYDLSERRGRCFILLARLAWAGVHGFRSEASQRFSLFSCAPFINLHLYLQTGQCFLWGSISKTARFRTKELSCIHFCPFSLFTTAAHFL